MRVLIFGASITQGFWDTEGGWVARLRRHYDELSVRDIEAEDNYPDIFNLGISADSSADILKRFDNEASARLRKNSSCAILFCVGTNNAYTIGNTKWPGPGSYENDLQELVNKAQEYTKNIMFVGLPPCEEEKTTPVFWRDIYYANERIKKIDSIMQDVAESNGIVYAPIFEAIKRRMEAGEHLYVDGLHPNNDGHQLIYELVLPELDKLISSK